MTTTLPTELYEQTEVERRIGGCSKRAPTGLRNRALIALLYGSGLRLGEALALRPHDLDLERDTQRILGDSEDFLEGAMAFLKKARAEVQGALVRAAGRKIPAFRAATKFRKRIRRTDYSRRHRQPTEKLLSFSDRSGEPLGPGEHQQANRGERRCRTKLPRD